MLIVEICQKAESILPRDEIESLVKVQLNKLQQIPLEETIPFGNCPDEMVKDHVDFIICSYNPPVEDDDSFVSHTKHEEVDFKSVSEVVFHIYRLVQEGAATETMKSDSEDLPVASHWILPCQELNGLWDTLCYDSNIKENLLQYVETSVLFSMRDVNPNIISWNKVVLLHGPPGTGKTSLCKALAQKATIRLSKYFNRGELLEINSHSLFSKWFSESGKLVMKLFTEIKTLLEDPKALVCILIDEVESLAHARTASLNGSEPSDSIRAVNALLTQLDQIKRYSNVLILTTSNVSGAIDLAFVDRADITHFIGHPEAAAITKIYNSCLKELMRTGIIQKSENFNWELLVSDYVVNQSNGLSGRTLRKVPFLTRALYHNRIDQVDGQYKLFMFLDFMSRVVDDIKENKLSS